MNIDSLTRLRQGLQKHFGPGAAVFVDPVLWMAGVVAVDLIRLDNWLQKRAPDYGRDESMSGYITRKYGEQTERVVRYWITGESRQQQEHHHG